MSEGDRTPAGEAGVCGREGVSAPAIPLRSAAWVSGVPFLSSRAGSRRIGASVQIDRATCVGARVERSAKLIALGGLLVLSAYCMARAMEGPGRWWLGWVALLPLFLSIRVLSPLGAALSGAVWGAALFVFATFAAETLVAPSVASFVLICAVPALYGFIGARLTRQIGFSPFLLALGWVGVEFALRPLGLRYGILAATQGDGLVLRAIGSFAGYALVSFLVAYVNAALLSVLACVPKGLVAARIAHGTVSQREPIDRLEVDLGRLGRLAPSRPRAPPFVAPICVVS